jgi:hypothetical protein
MCRVLGGQRWVELDEERRGVSEFLAVTFEEGLRRGGGREGGMLRGLGVGRVGGLGAERVRGAGEERMGRRGRTRGVVEDWRRGLGRVWDGRVAAGARSWAEEGCAVVGVERVRTAVELEQADVGKVSMDRVFQPILGGGDSGAGPRWWGRGWRSGQRRPGRCWEGEALKSAWVADELGWSRRGGRGALCSPQLVEFGRPRMGRDGRRGRQELPGSRGRAAGQRNRRGR